jgi:hypothetical protein
VTVAGTGLSVQLSYDEVDALRVAMRRQREISIQRITSSATQRTTHIHNFTERSREYELSHHSSRCFSRASSVSIALEETSAFVASIERANCSSTSSDSRVRIFA